MQGETLKYDSTVNGLCNASVFHSAAACFGLEIVIISLDIQSLKSRSKLIFFCFMGSHEFLKLFYNKNCETFLYANCRDIIIAFFVSLKAKRVKWILLRSLGLKQIESWALVKNVAQPDFC